ncbi:MFS transporter [Luteimonas sp. Y-2-2-4F]|nr:MFS transporter [Luteimonas sp. Y-2-2-4F]MCD9030255.1 MFS transporter [Luteimonas sp. Y-2-2-4F]
MHTDYMPEGRPEERARLMRQVFWRIMPFVTAIYLLAIIDRQNVGFAKLQMVGHLGMTETAYGLASSLFFIGYLLLEVPSVLAQNRFGARLWLARILGTWGAVTIALGFAHSGTMFGALRFLLGAAEAGAYPGLVFYITLWFPQAYRVRAVAVLTLGSSLGNMFGALVGGPLLELDGLLGLHGWQWVFIATGVPAFLMMFVVMKWLPNGPQSARFLGDADRAWLVRTLEEEARAKPARHGSMLSALFSGRVLFLSGVYTLIMISLYGVIYWTPTVVRAFGVGSATNGLLSAAPWALTTVLLLWLPKRLEGERRSTWCMAVASAVGVVAFVVTTQADSNTVRFLGLLIGTPCISLLLPCFWPLPSRTLSGAQAAGGIALISTIGSIGGFIAQNLMPWVARHGGAPAIAMLVPAGCLGVLALGSFVALLRPGGERPVAHAH